MSLIFTHIRGVLSPSLIVVSHSKYTYKIKYARFVNKENFTDFWERVWTERSKRWTSANITNFSFLKSLWHKSLWTILPMFMIIKFLEKDIYENIWRYWMDYSYHKKTISSTSFFFPSRHWVQSAKCLNLVWHKFLRHFCIDSSLNWKQL